MEKAIAVYGHYSLDKYNMSDINEYLDKGWKVKTIHTVVVDEYVTAIFILEK